MAELGRLATTLGIEVAGVLEQNRRDGTGYLGRGKREELRELVEEIGARFVVADDELTASQARVLEKACGVSVVDRTELIIRIFEAHARDAASRLEVELADLEYRLPRVKGKNPELSRLGGGGVTTRGPGEQQLEYDRRVIRERIATINRKLQEEKAGRAVRGARLKRGGTTDRRAGRLHERRQDHHPERPERGEEVDQGQALRDAGDHHASRRGEQEERARWHVARLRRHRHRRVHKEAPTQLVHSFASTLEVARDADVRVLCADASSEELEEEIQTVTRTLSGAVENGVGPGPMVMCLNKMDLVSEARAAELRRDHPHAVTISAIRDCEALLEEIYRAIASRRERMRVFIPHAEYAAASRLYGLAEIHAQENTESGLWMDVSLPCSASGKYAPYRV